MSDVIDKVPYLDLTKEFSELEKEWFELVRATGAQGSFILGPNVKAFEQEVADYIGSKYAVSVANGTDALMLSLRGLGIGPGDEVITTPYTFFATSESINMVGATPVFADILPGSFVIDPQSIRQKITKKTKAIMPVHLFGYPANMEELKIIADENNLKIIEDCAQAFGAQNGDTHGEFRVGSQGDTGCFSFYPTKVLGCYGDGGIITTSNKELADHLHKLRNHGAVKPFVHDEIGTNSRLDEVQAALLRIKLKRINQAIKNRGQVAANYSEQLKDVLTAVPAEPDNGIHAYNLYTVRAKNRDALRQHLTDNNVGTSLCYPQPLHLQPVYAGLGYQAGDLPVA
ncbi:MAG: DegT/DnrJ/EryC1/StrS family aminotransferase, partial [Acidiferrobacterales bacterium]